MKQKFYAQMGWFFTALALLTVARDIYFGHLYNFLWFCDISLILFAIGFFTHNTQLIKSIVSIGLFVHFIFIVEVLLFVIFNVPVHQIIIGILQSNWINVLVSVIIHLFTANIALFLTYKEKTQPISLFYSFILLIAIHLLTLVFAPPIANINFSQTFDMILVSSIPAYSFFWPLLVFVILVVPTYYFQRWMYWHYQKRTHKKNKKIN